MGTPHIHISFITLMNVGLMWLIFYFFWKTLSALWAENAFGQAMSWW